MYRKFIKRPLDIIIAIPLIIFFSPLFILVSFVIFIFNGKPIFFIQSRPGYKSKIFKIIKFRTMYNYDKNNKLSDENRVTKIGKFLRMSSIDELPELFNILKGEMSFVGPRPLLTEYLTIYNNEQIKRHNCIPGLTGLAQVNGRNITEWKDRINYDIQYQKNITFFQDLKIIIKSIYIVLFFKGINKDKKNIMNKFQG